MYDVYFADLHNPVINKLRLVCFKFVFIVTAAFYGDIYCCLPWIKGKFDFAQMWLAWKSCI